MSSSSATDGDEQPPEDASVEASLPNQIQSTQSLEFEDIELPDNESHKAIIEIYYKRYFYLVVGVLVLLFGVLFGLGLIPSGLQQLIAGYGSGVIVILFVLLWLYARRANS